MQSKTALKQQDQKKKNFEIAGLKEDSNKALIEKDRRLQMKAESSIGLAASSFHPSLLLHQFAGSNSPAWGRLRYSPRWQLAAKNHNNTPYHYSRVLQFLLE